LRRFAWRPACVARLRERVAEYKKDIALLRRDLKKQLEWGNDVEAKLTAARRELAAMTKERDELRRHADAIVDVFGEPYEFLDVDSEWVQRMDKVIAAYRASQQPKP
jgi:chromosome segregation ATPase